MEYSGQPLIYVANNTQLGSVTSTQGFDNKKVAIFVGDDNNESGRRIETHGKIFYCGSQNIDTKFTSIDGNITTINNTITALTKRLNNIDLTTSGSDTLANRVAELERKMNQLFPMDGDDANGRADFIDQLEAAISALQDANNAASTTIINTVNNNLDSIDFWYTYEEQQAQ